MKVLVADDDPVARLVLDTRLRSWGYLPVQAVDGERALAVMTGEGAPAIAVLDWMMPGLSGPDVIRQLRQRDVGARPYLILLTARQDIESIAEGLTTGADDYLGKPFDHRELQARLKVGERIVQLEHERVHRIQELETALANVRTLQGLLPMCAWCRKVRDDGDYWQKLEEYIDHHTGLQFSHGICPDCAHKLEEQQRDPRT